MENQKLHAKLAEAVKRNAKGVEILRDWLGSGGVPVDRKQAELRSLYCVPCPMNERISWRSVFKVSVAKAIIQQERIRTGAEMVLTLDKELGICSACGCYLRLKLWTPLKHILDHTSSDDLGELDEKCWILKELKHERANDLH